MFDHPECDGGHFSEIDTVAFQAQRVQSVRVSPLLGGAWCMPAFHPDIPAVIPVGSLDANDRQLAEFGLKGHAAGVPLSSNTFTKITTALKEQWEKYINKQVGGHSVTNLTMSVSAGSGTIRVTIGPDTRLTMLAFKPLAEALNREVKGLGWWAYEVSLAAKAGNYPIYDMPTIADGYQSYACCEGFTDMDLLRAMRDNGSEICSLADLKSNIDGFIPSDFIKEADGHAWMFKSRRWNHKAHKYQSIGKSPRIVSLRQVKQFLSSQSAPAHLKRAVQDFLALHMELQRTDSLMRHAEGLTQEDAEDGYVSEDDIGYLEPIGASCMVIWDGSPDVLSPFYEQVQHHEQNQMNGDSSTDIHMVFKAKQDDPASTDRLIQSMKDLVTRHAAINKAFSHLKVIQ